MCAQIVYSVQVRLYDYLFKLIFWPLHSEFGLLKKKITNKNNNKNTKLFWGGFSLMTPLYQMLYCICLTAYVQ